MREDCGGLWSLHGGHSWPACSHADSSLETMVEAAITADLETYGITEHAPKARQRDLDADDLAAGRGLADMSRRSACSAKRSFQR